VPAPGPARGDRRRRPRDERRRGLGQNFLVDQDVVDALIDSCALAPGELVVDVGAGRGAMTLACARAGARVLAVEVDPVWASRLADAVERAAMSDRVRIVRADALSLRWPREPYRVVANPPFGITTALLDTLLADPEVGPYRCDLVVQAEVARKRAQWPPSTLRSAAWAPWWTFELGTIVSRRAFRPIPAVDAAVLRVIRRADPVLPTWLAPTFHETLRTPWTQRSPGSRATR
jgi:23S rRNA (adenine-N6)-dimethyltransferase